MASIKIFHVEIHRCEDCPSCILMDGSDEDERACAELDGKRIFDYNIIFSECPLPDKPLNGKKEIVDDTKSEG